MKSLSRIPLVLFIVAASAFRCEAIDYTAGPGLGIGIPDNGYNGTLTPGTLVAVDVVVPDAATITDVNVTVAVTHGFIGDLTIKLKSPSGTIVTLLNRPGSTAPDNGAESPLGDSSNLATGFPITFDDSASVSAENMGNTISDVNVCEADAICTFIPAPDTAPAGNLATLNGENTAGTWTLYIGDSVVGDFGSIDRVTLSFTTSGPTECTPPPAGMIAWWSGDGNAADIAGIHNGTFNGDATTAAGKVGNAFSFDGTGDYVDVGEVKLPVTFTIDAWVNAADLTANRMILSKDDGGSNRSYDFRIDLQGKLHGHVINAPGVETEYQTTNAVVTAGSWFHVAVTYDGNAGAGVKFRFFVNGQEVPAVVSPGSQDTGGEPRDVFWPAKIGIYSASGQPFTGLIDELELFNRVLNAGEIQSIWAADTLGKCKPTIYVSNTGNSSIEQFDANGGGTPFSIIGSNVPQGLAFDSGYTNLYVVSNGNGGIVKYDSNGNPTTFVPASTLNNPNGIAFDKAGNLYVADRGVNKILKFDPAAQETTFADSSSGLIAPLGLAFDGNGNLYVSNFGDGNILKFDHSGNVTPVADISINEDVSGIAFDKDGNLFVAGSQTNKIFKIDTSNAVTTFADSTDGLNNPYGLAFDQFGNLFVVNESGVIAGSHVLKFDTAGNHITFAGTAGLNLPSYIAIKPGAVPTPAPTPVERQFVNISSRASVGTGDNVSIGGFIIKSAPANPIAKSKTNGPGVTKRVLIRGMGPSLAVNGVPVPGRLADPVLELCDHTGAVIATNDDWKVPAQNQTDVEATGLPPGDDHEAAIIATLNASENYTAILRGKNNTSGIGLIEIYDLEATSGAQLANISTRAQVLTGNDVLIGGIIVRGGDVRQVIVRGMGPSLANFGISNPLLNPQLDLHDAQGTLLAHNDNWKEEPDGTPNAGREAAITATNFAPSNNNEAAILFNPSPGNYTAIVSGVGGTTGIGLVEAYRLGAP